MKFRIYTLLSVVLLLVGCKEHTLYANLSEHEANEIIALMYGAGLDAQKVGSKDGTYSVLTAKNAFPQAMSLLRANDLPRERFASLGDVFEKEGFVSSPLEERARLNHALSQEMSNTLSNIDGVSVARVHLTLPQRDRLTNEAAAASASVFIKHRSEVSLENSVAKIKALMIDGVENLAYDDVTVVFFSESPLVFPKQPSEKLDPVGKSFQVVTMQILNAPGLIILGLLVLSSGIFCWFFSHRLVARKSNG